MPQSPAKDSSDSPPLTPRWVKVFGAVMIALVIAIIFLHLTGNSFGPGTHVMPVGYEVPQP